MIQTIRLFLLVQSVIFITAVLIHTGSLLGGYEDQAAATAEGIIATILVLGLALTWLLPARTRLLGLVAQGLAMLGTLLGAFIIAIGIGPRTPLDIALHAAMLITLAWGLIFTARAPAGEPGQSL